MRIYKIIKKLDSPNKSLANSNDSSVITHGQFITLLSFTED